MTPDVEQFNQQLVASVLGRQYDGDEVARDFRALFLRDNPELGKRVLFSLLQWCGEFEDPPYENDRLQRWAGKRELAQLIRVALNADLTTPPPPEEAIR